MKASVWLKRGARDFHRVYLRHQACIFVMLQEGGFNEAQEDLRE